MTFLLPFRGKSFVLGFCVLGFWVFGFLGFWVFWGRGGGKAGKVCRTKNYMYAEGFGVNGIKWWGGGWWLRFSLSGKGEGDGKRRTTRTRTRNKVRGEIRRFCLKGVARNGDVGFAFKLGAV